REDGDRHRRRERRHHLHRGGAVRRRQAIGTRPRGIQVRARGIPRGEVRAHGAMTGEEFKDDYRRALPRDLVQQLTRRSAWRATLAVVEDFVVLTIAIGIALAYWPNPLAI